MGLLIKLQNGDTALKSLKFGKDRLGGGDSGQPYIKNPILDEPGQLSQGDNDFLLRGGLRAPINAAEDVARLTKYMFDLKSPSGLLFIAKQNLLSRVAPKTESSKGIGYAGGALNEGVYTPLSTLAQAGVGFAGIHLNKQGLDPTGLIPGLSINKYENILKDQTTDENRLVNILTYRATNFNGVKGYDINQGQDVITYGGGPGSILGVGKTHIRYADQRTGVDNPKIPKAFFSTDDRGFDDYSIFKNPLPLLYQGTKIFHNSVSKKYQNLTGIDPLKDKFSTTNDSTSLQLFSNSVYKSGSLDPINNIESYQVSRSIALQKHYPTPESYPTYVSPINQILYNTGEASRQLVKDPVYRLEQGTFIPQNVDDTDLKGVSYSSENTLKRDYSDKEISDSGGYLWKDFNNGSETHKEGYLADLDKNAGSYLKDGKLVYFNNGYYGGIAPDFRLTPRDKRGFPQLTNNAQNPDQPNSIGKYNSGKGETYSRWITDGGSLNTTNNTASFRYKALDTIYYDSNSINKSSFRNSNSISSSNDLINFSISIINPTNPEATGSLGSNTLRFRAYIDNFSDSYTAEWKSQTYMGRAEKFYKYDAFGRSISLGFTIVADNKNNLDTMYDQLNTLAASLAPTYTGQGYMAGNLHRVTVGHYISNQVGIIDGLTYEIIDDASWDIDKDKQLPRYIKVTGIKFTPIHGFRPEMLWEGSQHKFVRQ